MQFYNNFSVQGLRLKGTDNLEVLQIKVTI